jgi:hypothetical protein
VDEDEEDAPPAPAVVDDVEALVVTPTLADDEAVVVPDAPALVHVKVEVEVWSPPAPVAELVIATPPPPLVAATLETAPVLVDDDVLAPPEPPTTTAGGLQAGVPAAAATRRPAAPRRGSARAAEATGVEERTRRRTVIMSGGLANVVDPPWPLFEGSSPGHREISGGEPPRRAGA